MHRTGALASVLALVACRDPTEMRVRVTTDLACGDLRGVGVALGAIDQVDALPLSSTSNACDASGATNDVGTLVVTPANGTGEELGIEVVAGVGVTADACKDPNATHDTKSRCVVARRALRFQAHTSLDVPVLLERDCVGVTCADPHTTCDHGVCVSAEAACDATGACVTPMGDGGPPDADRPDGLPTPTQPGCPGWPSLASAPTPMVGMCPGRRNQTAAVIGGGAPRKDGLALPATFHVPPVVRADGVVAFVTSAGVPAIYDPTSGRTEVSKLVVLGGAETPAIVRADDAIFFASGPALGVDDFNMIAKSINCPLGLCADPSIDKTGNLYVGTSKGVAVVDPGVGTFFKTLLSTNVTVGPSMSDGETMIALTRAGKAFEAVFLNLPSPTVVNHVTLLGAPLGPAIVAPDGFEANVKAFVVTDSALQKIGEASPAVETTLGWAAVPVPLCSSKVATLPALGASGFLYFPTCGAGRPAWRAIDGHTLNLASSSDGPIASAPVDATPTIDGAGHVFAIATDGTIYDEKGKRGALTPSPGATFQSSLVVLPDGGVAAGDTKGGLHFTTL